MGVAQSKSATTPLSFLLHLTTDQTFQMRYITFLSSRLFNFDGSYILNQLGYTNVKYLNLKV